jgi:aminoglycoside phosphotransferase family enzyme
MNDDEVRTLAERGLFLNRSLHGQIEETHISWVILTKKFAFKIKKPVKLSFLNFSTQKKRERYCYRELQLNQRFSPIYLDVLPVCHHGDAWHIGKADGKTVDYAVRMKRMRLSKRMDRLLEKKVVNKSNIVSLVQVIASFHAKADVVNDSFHLGKAKAAFNDIQSIIRLSGSHLGKEYATIIKRSIAWSNAFLKNHATRIRERIAQGFYRDVHGDLHSGNIFLYKEPILFDCIEFNDAYRRIDVLNEIAFFCMDMEAYNQGKLARLFIREYQQQLPCFQTIEDKLLFVYYKCFRANVRAKVHALSAMQAHDVEGHQHHVRAWRNYVRLIGTYIR